MWCEIICVQFKHGDSPCYFIGITHSKAEERGDLWGWGREEVRTRVVRLTLSFLGLGTKNKFWNKHGNTLTSVQFQRRLPPRCGGGWDGPLSPAGPGPGCQTCLLLQRCFCLNESQSSFHFAHRRELAVALWVNGWLLYYFLYFSVFGIFHPFKREPWLPAWSFKVKAESLLLKTVTIPVKLYPISYWAKFAIFSHMTQASLGLHSLPEDYKTVAPEISGRKRSFQLSKTT